MRILALGCVMLAAVGCTVQSQFVCETDSECQHRSELGRCETNRSCSFPDPECRSGRRYGAFGSPSVGDRCVPLADETDMLITDGNVNDGAITDAAAATDAAAPDAAATDADVTTDAGLDAASDAASQLDMTVTQLLAHMPIAHFGAMDADRNTPEMRLYFSNTGAAPTQPLSLALTGSADSLASFEITNNGCDGLALAAGSTCLLRARFRPSTLGGDAKEVIATLSDGTNTIASTLRGTRVTSLNFMFTVTTVANGNLGGLAGADAVCAQRAQQASLPGNYVAWLSTTTVSAVSRLGTARGWKLPDGRLFADSISDALTFDELFTTPSVDEAGTQLPAGTTAWTGTGANGTSANHCSSWTSALNSVGGTRGAVHCTGSQWTIYDGFSACNNSYGFYCFQIDYTTAIPTRPRFGRTMFTTAAPFVVGGGITAADALCQSEASGAGVAGTYKAFLATTTASSGSRFTVKRQPVVRIDGTPIVDVDSDLLLANPAILRSPISQTAAGDYVDYRVWTGMANTLQPTSSLFESCNDWTTPATGSTFLGESTTTNNGWNWVVTDACGRVDVHLYCLQE